jgi:hypothetical protein
MKVVFQSLFLACVMTVSAAETNVLTSAEITAAREMYAAKCAKCHKFYEPKKYSEEEWQSWMMKMGKKSRLKPDQQTLLGRYLDSYRAGQLTGKPEAK